MMFKSLRTHYSTWLRLNLTQMRHNDDNSEANRSKYHLRPNQTHN